MLLHILIGILHRLFVLGGRLQVNAMSVMDGSQMSLTSVVVIARSTFGKINHIQKGAILAEDAAALANSIPLLQGTIEMLQKDGYSRRKIAPLQTLLDLQNCASTCLLYTSPSPRDVSLSRMPSSA